MWVIDQQARHKFDCFLGGPVAEDLVPGERLDLRKFVLVIVGIHGQNLLLRRRSQDFDYFHELIDATLARENRLTEHELCDDTTDGPNINISVIVRIAKDQLRSAVVA